MTSIFGQAVKDIFNTSKDVWKGTRWSVFLLLVVIPSFASHAQALESLVNAEKAFAQTSVDKNTRAAFLEFFNDSTLAFGNGQPNYGRADWEKREANTNYLFWWPVYADIAASGDFGYTTGPAVFGPDKSTKEAKGGIYYASVWKKNADGQWKVLADMGSAVYDPSEDLVKLNTTTRPSKKPGNREIAVADLEKEYERKLNEKQSSFEASSFSTEGRIHRRGIPPVISKASIEKLTEPRKHHFQYIGGEVARSNDMAFTYGLVKITSIKDGKEIVTPACYMRVWKNEDGNWKIVLDVIGG